MTKDEALEHIANGHTAWTVTAAREICAALGVSWDGHNLVERCFTDPHPLGCKMRPGHEGALGVNSLALSRYVAERLGVAGSAQDFLGRGSQAREYARLIESAIAAAEGE